MFCCARNTAKSTLPTRAPPRQRYAPPFITTTTVAVLRRGAVLTRASVERALVLTPVAARLVTVAAPPSPTAPAPAAAAPSPAALRILSPVAVVPAPLTVVVVPSPPAAPLQRWCAAQSRGGKGKKDGHEKPYEKKTKNRWRRSNSWYHYKYSPKGLSAPGGAVS